MKNREIEFKVLKTPLWYERYRHIIWRPKPETVWDRLFFHWKLLWGVDSCGDVDTLFYPYEFSEIKKRVKTEDDMRAFIAENKSKRKTIKGQYDSDWKKHSE